MLPTAELARPRRPQPGGVQPAGDPGPAFSIRRLRWRNGAESTDRAGEIKRWLDGLDVVEFHIESATTDLKIRLGAKRRWAGISGRNIPSFELFVSPDWRGTHGVFCADQPSFRNGNIVRRRAPRI